MLFRDCLLFFTCDLWFVLLLLLKCDLVGLFGRFLFALARLFGGLWFVYYFVCGLLFVVLLLCCLTTWVFAVSGLRVCVL